MLGSRQQDRSRLWGALVELWVRHPRIELAVRTSVAALLAWRVANWLPGPAHEYPYYAPLGAVLGTYPTVAASTRESLRAVLAILLGALVGTVVGLLELPSALGVALAVLAGVLLGGLRWLGEHRSWVPTAALFVLLLGTSQGHPEGFVVAYVGLSLLGAGIAVLLNLLLPALRREGSVRRLADVREALAAQVDDLAEALDGDIAPTEQEWHRRHHDLQPVLQEMREALTTTREAQRANLRRRQVDPAESRRLLAEGGALERVARLVEDLTDLFAEVERGDYDRVPLGRTLRPPTVEALRQLSAVLRADRGSELHPDVREEAGRAVDRLWEALASTAFDSAVERSVAGSVVNTLDRCVRALGRKQV